MTVLLLLSPLILLLVRASTVLLGSALLGAYGTIVLAYTVATFYLAYARYIDPSEARPASVGPLAELPGPPLVTFMVAVKDEVRGIEQCVRSMLASDYRCLDVIVVDDASTDGTTELLEELATELGFQLIVLPENVGKKHALSIAAGQANGEILAFTDSDTILAVDALGRCVRALAADPELGAVSGHARALNPDKSYVTKAQDVWYEGSFRVGKAAEAVLGSVTCVSGPLAVFRREAIYNFFPAWANDTFLGQPFRFATDRQLTAYVLGQVWVGERLKDRFKHAPFVAAELHPNRHWKVGYVRSAKAWTNVPDCASTFLRQQIRWKKSFIRSFCFTSRFMWRRGFGAASLYYGHTLFVCAAPVMAVLHLVVAPARGLWLLTALYLAGVLLKGTVWGLAYRWENPNCSRWRYRPFLSVFSSVILSWFLLYSLATIRRGVWSRPT